MGVTFAMGWRAYASSSPSETRHATQALTIELMAPPTAEGVAGGQAGADAPSASRLLKPSTGGLGLRGPQHAEERAQASGPVAAAMDAVAQGISIQDGAQGSHAPRVWIKGSPAERLNLFYGSQPLSDFLTFRDVSRLLPRSLLSEVQISAGTPGSLEAWDDFYPSLRFIPCEGRSCSALGAQPFAETVGIRTQMATDSLRSLELTTGVGAQLGQPTSSGYWGAHVARDTGAVVVRSDANTPGERSDDVDVTLRNNDWQRQSAVHSSTVLIPGASTRLSTRLLVSEVYEGLTRGPGYLRDRTRAQRRLGLAELGVEQMLPGDGTLMEWNLRALDSRSAVQHSSLDPREPMVDSMGQSVSLRVAARTPRVRRMGLQQLQISSEIFHLRSAQDFEFEAAPQRGARSGENRLVQRLGLNFGLGEFMDVPLGLGLSSQIQASESWDQLRCSEGPGNLCRPSSRSLGVPRPQVGVLLTAEHLGLTAGLSARTYGRRPDLVEKNGSGAGMLANPLLRDEAKRVVGLTLATALVEASAEASREDRLIVLESGRSGRSQFVNLEDPVTRLSASLAAGGTLPGGGTLALRYGAVRAFLESQKKRQLARTPKNSVALVGFSPEVPVMSRNGESFAVSAGLGAQWRDRLYLDQRNTLVADAQGSLSPEIRWRWLSTSAALAASVGSVFVFPSKVFVTGALGESQEMLTTESGGLLAQEQGLFLKLTGDF